MVTAIKTHERIKIPVVDYEYKSAKKWMEAKQCYDGLL